MIVSIRTVPAECPQQAAFYSKWPTSVLCSHLHLDSSPEFFIRQNSTENILRFLSNFRDVESFEPSEGFLRLNQVKFKCP